MILFLNFIPIEFMGGTEKWMNNTAKKLHEHESTEIISVHQQITNSYGMLVAKRKYNKRINNSEIHNHISLKFQSFIPFTKEWKDIKLKFNKSRVIYTRYEILELLLVCYFSGITGIRKTIAGIHSPYIYTDPISFFDKLHNNIYGSWIYKHIMRQMKIVHVLNTKNENYFKTNFNLQNVVYVPNGAEAPKIIKDLHNNKNQLNVLFVGELSVRKGVDKLLDIINKAPQHMHFTIVGDGILKKDVAKIIGKTKHADYLGYANKNMLDKLYRQNDVLILPSRAESMSLALLEAMSYGLVIVDSIDTQLGLDKKVEYSCSNEDIHSYINTLEKIFNLKKTNKLNKSEVRNYFNNNFASEKVYSKLSEKIFAINTI